MLSKIKLSSLMLLATIVVGCGGASKSKVQKLDIPSSPITSESDSLAYIIGLSVAQNLMAMDSMIDLRVVGTALAHVADSKQLITPDNAREAYLRYKLHIEPERQRNYELQYLKELAQADRSYTLSQYGFIYNVAVIGNEALTPRNNGDWVELHYTISRMDGSEVLFSSYAIDEPVKSAFSDLPEGIKHAIKLIGNGGKIVALIPSKLAYDSEGDAELGIVPFETLLYEIELTNVEKNGAKRHEATNDKNSF
ncbi:MAG: FKBP-type peptidyl-prolyl cis-trans isomerase [Rikenellaceae bacterium]